MKSSRQTSNGFTLVELTIVLIIVSFLLGGILLPLSAQQDIRLQTEAETQLNEARDAVIGFAQINGRLPCPTRNAAGNGKEDCSVPLQLYGFLPWGELGVRPTDPWGRLIQYRVSSTFIAPPAAAITTSTVGEIKVQTRQGTTLVDLTNDAPRDVAFVILSYGKNGYFGTNSGGVTGPGAPTGLLHPDEVTNKDALTTAGSTIFVSRTATPESIAVIGAFDDQLVWVPRSLLINRLVAAGRL